MNYEWNELLGLIEITSCENRINFYNSRFVNFFVDCYCKNIDFKDFPNIEKNYFKSQLKRILKLISSKDLVEIIHTLEDII
jgi:hypothetical protein